MKVVILCGGQGTRLREETEYRPKPMVEVGGRPILWHIMKTYAHYGYDDFVLCLGYKGNVIREFFLNYHAMSNDFTVSLGSRRAVEFHGQHSEENWNVTLVDTGQETLTAQRIYMIREHIGDETFMVTYGDGLTDLNLDELVQFHQQSGCQATLTAVRDVSRFGVVETDRQGRVAGFKEKPQVEERINAGFFVFEGGVFEYLKDDPGMLEQNALPALARAGELALYAHDGFWQCMDTYRDYAKLNEMWSAGDAPWLK